MPTRKMEKLSKSLKVENISHCKILKMINGLNKQVDVLCEKMCIDDRIADMVVLVFCGVDKHREWDALAIKPI